MAKKAKRNKWQIILCNHGNYLETLHYCPSEKIAYEHYNRLLDESSKVVFSKQWNNLSKEIVESQYEIVIIKCREKYDKNKTVKILDDNETFASYATNEENWIVIDRHAYNIEETFWVYGYHPRIQRKNFNWIYENLVDNGIDDGNIFKTLAVYKNKFLVETGPTLDMVICKNGRDCYRLYNQIEEWLRKRNKRNVIYLGDLGRSKYKREWIDKIQNTTGWTRHKIKRPSTRP